MKYVQTFESYRSEQAYYYNSIGEIYTLGEIRNIEVRDRGNYSAKEFNSWLKKYKASLDDSAVWVTKERKDVLNYVYDKKDGLYKIPASAGYLMEESDDDDGGFIMVITDKNAKFEWDKIKSGEKTRK